ncbi:MAG: glucan biosynthesis protein [Hyphomonadaceae bacterium]
MRFLRGALAPVIAAILVTAGAMPARAEESRALDLAFSAASQRATLLAAAPYQAPANTLPAVFSGADYDAYRKLRPRPEASVWGKAGNPFALEPLPRGWLYPEPVSIHVVHRDGTTGQFDSPNAVDFVDFPAATDGDRHALGVSGWRAITRPGVAGDGYEFAVFQGGVYFRAVGQGQVYGASARALAIGTGSPKGEEFPRFTDFWVLEPETRDDTLRFVAVSDSPSAAAVYRFALRPGSDAIIDVAAEIHPRVDISEAGVAPLSSMYLHGPADPRANSASSADKRPEVHDSDGLSIISKSGEAIWRPLANPAQLQGSAFAGTPARFGFEQRQRDPAAYADGEAKYEQRPSIVIEPVGDWGEGDIRLLEIPTANEYADNVTAFWRPAQPWLAGATYSLAYRLHWSAALASTSLARVISTEVGMAPETDRLRRFDLAFEAGAPLSEGQLKPDVWSAGGKLSNIRVARDGDRRARLRFDLEPGAASVVEIHAALTNTPMSGETSQLTETWLFRWTPE